MNNENNQTDLTKGQAKRLQRRKEIAGEKRKKLITKIIWGVVAVCIVGVIGFFVGKDIYKKANTTTSSNDFSAMLEASGLISGVDVNDYVTTVDYKNLNVALSEIEFTDAEVEESIQSTLSSNQIISSDSALSVSSGNKVSVDYVGKVNGETVEGQDTESKGKDITIGSATLTEAFDNALLGHKAGDTYSVDITFASDYATAALAGKTVSYDVTVNGIYVNPEFNDAFVAEKLSSYATTAEGYRTYLKNSHYDSNLTTYIEETITKNSSVSSYPSKYLKQLKSVAKYMDEYYYQYYNQMYYENLGSYAYNSFSDYTQMDDAAYEESLTTKAKAQLVNDMAYQYIYENAGLSITDEEYTAYLTTLGETAEENYGKGYIMQQLIHEKVMTYLRTVITVA